MNDTYDSFRALCQKRRSVRAFLDRPVSQDCIEKIKEIAYTSPYASNRKNWEIVVVKERELIARIAQVVRERSDAIQKDIRADFREGYASYVKNFFAFESAPVLFIPTFRTAPTLSLMLKDPPDSILEWERDNFTKSISCVGMLILLAAESLGLGSCYMTGPLIAEEQIAELIHIKKGRRIGAIIPVGYSK